MIVVTPIAIPISAVNSTTASTTFGPAEWAPNTSYSIGTQVSCISKNSVFSSLNAAINHNPADSDWATYWTLVGAIETYQDPVAWDNAWTYDPYSLTHDEVTYSNGVYVSLAMSNVGYQPDTNPTKWGLKRYTNKYAMFDTASSSYTRATTSFDVVFACPNVDTLAFIGCKGSTISVTVKSTLGGTTVYSSGSVSLTTTGVLGNTIQKPLMLFTSIPKYAGSYVYVTISGTGTVWCTTCIGGNSLPLGNAQYSASTGIHDYSRKATDDVTGIVSLEQRHFAKTMNVQVRANNTTITELTEALEALRATPALWVADETVALPLSVYGWYKDFSLVVDYPTCSVYSLQIEGMT